MNEDSITQYIADTFAGVECVVASGGTFFIYDPDRDLPQNRRFPFATLTTTDEYDCASNLGRASVFRLNTGVGKAMYRDLFGVPPSPPDAGKCVNTGHDFTALDQIMPHPVHAPQSWICVLNPSDETFETVKPLLAEAYGMSVKRNAKSRQDDGR